ncbi:hypothetical protein Y1Q_0013997 [Alligator mississippiensis]|uniref:Uncharacterized protein n=1 Tax=Alligator mississippiensis TaxID=8496 RepID=A0A151PDE6_ALLMI|nr:hypothetical protein Y1Q_0013997 [Alligator mississippiensis]
MAGQLQLEFETEDVEELLASHSQELTNEELVHLEEQKEGRKSGPYSGESCSSCSLFLPCHLQVKKGPNQFVEMLQKPKIAL